MHVIEVLTALVFRSVVLSELMCLPKRARLEGWHGAGLSCGIE